MTRRGLNVVTVTKPKASKLATLVVAALAGVAACVTPGTGGQAQAQPLRDRVGGYELELLVDGVPVRTFQHAGETYVLGQRGDRYVIRVHNHSARRVEAVVSVDGLDAIDGKTADVRRKRGYLIPAYGFVDVDGWRLSNREVAAFRFSSVRDSYAGKTGRARNVGVIGVAVFPERVYYRPVPRPYPYERRPSWDEVPYSGEDDRYGYGQPSDGAQRRKSEAAPPAAAEAEAPSSAARGRASADAAGTGGIAAAPRPQSRPGLGTEFGEAMHSQVHEVAFERANASSPAVVLGVRYNDRAGLYAMGIDVDGWESPDDVALRRTADPFPSTPGRFSRPPVGWTRW